MTEGRDASWPPPPPAPPSPTEPLTAPNAAPPRGRAARVLSNPVAPPDRAIILVRPAMVPAPAPGRIGLSRPATMSARRREHPVLMAARHRVRPVLMVAPHRARPDPTGPRPSATASVGRRAR